MHKEDLSIINWGGGGGGGFCMISFIDNKILYTCFNDFS